MNIFVGNLSFSATENDVKNVFEAFGTVSSVSIKKKSGKNSRGFGFVGMPDELQAQSAIAGLQNKDFMGRTLIVSIERPKAVKPKKVHKETPKIFTAPIIPEKKSSKTSGAKVWQKRKGRGTAKPWKKKPGGVNKKFKFAR